jgi:hypothetical protein
MYMRSATRGHAVGPADVPCTGLRIDAVPDVLAGAVARARWKHDHPEYGWLALALIVAAADYTGSRTMSDMFRTASRHPVSGPCIAIGWGVLTAHLFGFIPPAYDPFNLLMRRTSD